MDDDDDYSKTCGPVLDRRNPVNLDELFVPLSVKSHECENLVAVAEAEDESAEDPDSEPTTAVAVETKATSLVNDINTRFSNDCTQTVGPYLDTADPSRKVSVRDLFKPLDFKSKEVHNLAEEPCSGDEDGDDGPTQQTQTCGPVIIDSEPNLERVFDRKPDPDDLEVHISPINTTYDIKKPVRCRLVGDRFLFHFFHFAFLDVCRFRT